VPGGFFFLPPAVRLNFFETDSRASFHTGPDEFRSDNANMGTGRSALPWMTAVTSPDFCTTQSIHCCGWMDGGAGSGVATLVANAIIKQTEVNVP
jgi:hypothetical protein